MKNNTRLPLLRTENLVVKELPNELLIYDLENNKAFCLNETARLIMEKCDGQTSIDQAKTSLNHKLKTNISDEIIWLTIEQLKKFDLIETGYEVPVQTTKVTRRKILQSAASLGISLPIITSLVAPTAAHAQSSCIPIESVGCVITGGASNCCQPGFCVTTGPVSICEDCIPLGSGPCTQPSDCCGGSFCAAFGPGGSLVCFTD